MTQRAFLLSSLVPRFQKTSNKEGREEEGRKGGREGGKGRGGKGKKEGKREGEKKVKGQKRGMEGRGLSFKPNQEAENSRCGPRKDPKQNLHGENKRKQSLSPGF